MAETLNSTGKAQHCSRGKRRTIPKRPRKNPSGYNTPCWHPFFLQPRSENNSPFAREALCPYQIPLKSPFIRPAPRAMLSWASLACFIAFQLPGALLGEARQMRQRRILAGRIPGAAEEPVPAAGDGCSGRQQGWPAAGLCCSLPARSRCGEDAARQPQRRFVSPRVTLS